jgi:hypothetical protein
MRLALKLQPLFAALFLVIGLQQALAGITIDLGPSGIAKDQITPITFSDLNGTPVTGTRSVDFVFSNNSFVRLFNQYTIASPDGSPTIIGTSPSFDISLTLQTSGSELVGFLHGTGYLTDHTGNAIPGFGITGSASTDDGRMIIGLFPLYRDNTGAPNLDLLRPLEFYGAHFDLVLPNAPSLEITGANFGLFDYGGQFGIGPNIPLDIPEPSTVALASLGTLAFALFFRRR